MTVETPAHARTTGGDWQDTARSPEERVEALIAAMTVEEKVAQLYGIWVGASAEGGDVAPHQHDLSDGVELETLLPNGLGQLTRPFGTAPVDAALGAVSLWHTQKRIVAENRFGIPALAHEECLAGFAAWGATAYPVPLSWGASFDPELVEKMAARIGADMRSVGVHQGLAPVLDVVRDARWGRVEETIGEDPFLIGTIASAYVRGLESSGIVATLKHFVGYSASKAGRNLAPVSIGRRELADVLLLPFEMALRETTARSVMNAYTDLDGIPTAADRSLLTELLRDTWGFTGTVVADYFAVSFLHLLHGVAASSGEAAVAALTAGIDVELPTVQAYGTPLLQAISDGRIAESVIDTSLRRVLMQKLQLGLLDADWSGIPTALKGFDLSAPNALRGSIDLDTAENRALAATLAERSIVLLRNDGVLPLAQPKRIAIIGPNAEDPYAVLGCYSFPAHIGVQHPSVPIGINLPTVVAAVTAEFPESMITHVRGTSVDGGETDEFDAAIAAATAADVVILALGDRSGLFGRGTSGEGCDAESLRLPGAQQELLDAIIAAGTPTVVTLLAGRPYALGNAATTAAAIVQTFFPGEEGTTAIAGVLSGRINPSGRLPVSVPAHPGSGPSTYLSAPLARASDVSNIDPTPAFPFGHGLGYSTFDWRKVPGAAVEIAIDGSASVAIDVTNTGGIAGADIVQLYLHDPVASVVRPVQRLIGFARVHLAPGDRARVEFEVSADLTSFTSASGTRIVEPGELTLGLGRSSSDIPIEHGIRLVGAVRTVDHTRALRPVVTITTER